MKAQTRQRLIWRLPVLMILVALAILLMIERRWHFLSGTAADLLLYATFMIVAIFWYIGPQTYRKVIPLPNGDRIDELMKSWLFVLAMRSIWAVIMCMEAFIFVEERIHTLTITDHPAHLIPFWRWLLIASGAGLITAVVEWIRFRPLERSKHTDAHSI